MGDGVRRCACKETRVGSRACVSHRQATGERRVEREPCHLLANGSQVTPQLHRPPRGNRLPLSAHYK